MTLILAQQQATRRTQRDIWAVEQIAAISQCPVDSMARNWPLVRAALREFGWDDPRVDAAAIATIAIETASTFEPVEEAYYLYEHQMAHLMTKDYWPFFGRGYIQLTWRSNYQKAGEALGLDLVNDPSLALDPRIAARILAWYMTTRGVADAALREDWASVRYLVLGGYDGLTRLRHIAITLLGHMDNR